MVNLYIFVVVLFLSCWSFSIFHKIFNWITGRKTKYWYLFKPPSIQIIWYYLSCYCFILFLIWICSSPWQDQTRWNESCLIISFLCSPFFVGVNSMENCLWISRHQLAMKNDDYHYGIWSSFDCNARQKHNPSDFCFSPFRFCFVDI